MSKRTPTEPNQVWTSDIVTDPLAMAWFRKRPAAGLMHHSDRGSQYASHAFFQDKLINWSDLSVGITDFQRKAGLLPPAPKH